MENKKPQSEDQGRKSMPEDITPLYPDKFAVDDIRWFKTHPERRYRLRKAQFLEVPDCWASDPRYRVLVCFDPFFGTLDRWILDSFETHTQCTDFETVLDESEYDHLLAALWGCLSEQPKVFSGTLARGAVSARYRGEKARRGVRL